MENQKKYPPHGTTTITVETPLGCLEARESGSELFPGIEIKCNGIRIAMVEYTDTYKRIQTIVHSSSGKANDDVEDLKGRCGIVPFKHE